MAVGWATRRGLSAYPGSALHALGNGECSVKRGECARGGGRTKTNTTEVRASSSETRNALPRTWLSVGSFPSSK